MASPAPAAPRTLAALFAVLLKTAPRARPPSHTQRPPPAALPDPSPAPPGGRVTAPSSQRTPPAFGPSAAIGGRAGGRGGAAPAAAPGPRGVRRGAALPAGGGAVAVRGELWGRVPLPGALPLPAVAEKESRGLMFNLLKFRASGAASCFTCSCTGSLLAPEAARAALCLRSHGPELGGPRCGGSGASKTHRASCVLRRTE